MVKLSRSFQRPWAAITCMLTMATFIAGCSSKPPACADAETLKLVQTMVVDGMKKRTAADINDPGLEPDVRARFQQFTEKFLTNIKAELSLIVTNGYSAEAKKYTCAAKLTVTTSRSTYSIDTAYTTQKTEDKNSDFVLELSNFQGMLNALYGDYIQQITLARAELRGEKPVAQEQTSQTAQAGGADAGKDIPDGSSKYSKQDGTLQIIKRGGRVDFQINSSQGQYTCEMKGTAPLAPDGTAKFLSTDADKCVVKFKFTGNKIEVDTDGCDSHYCGQQAGGTMDGVYKR